MGEKNFSFKIGDFKCMAVCDGIYTYTKPAPLLFPTAPGEELDQKLREFGIDSDRWLEWKSPYTCLFVDTGKYKILVDTGGGKEDQSSRETGQLLDNLRADGISPGDIDFVILTHAHPDHICGNTDEKGEIAFPRARYVISKEEWEFWNSFRAGKELPETFKEGLIRCARQKLPPIENQLNLVEGEEEIVEGIRTILTPGHTPGHLVVSFCSKGEELIAVSDLLIHPIHVEKPQWYTAVDYNPEKNITSRIRILEKAEKENALLIGFHFPFPGLGRVKKEEGKWKWEPQAK